MIFCLLILSSLLLNSLVVGIGSGKDVVIVGDSWGVLGGPQFRVMLSEHNTGLSVANYAVSGSTTSDWAENPNKVKDYIDENPNAQYIWMSLGGNDASHYLPSCTKEKPTLVCVEYILEKV